MKRIFCLFVVIVITVFSIGCSEIETYDDNSQTTIPEEINYPVTAEDIIFEKAPERVVSLSPAITHILCEFDLEEYVVGIGEYCEKTSALEKAEIVGSPANPDIERIIALNPEVVFTQSPISLADMTKLEAKGIKVIYNQSPKGLNELVDYYAMIAMIFMGNGYYNNATKEKFEEVDQAIIEAQNLELDFRFVYILTEDMAVATGDTLAGDILSIYGQNIAQEYEELTMEIENIIEENPNVIFIAEDVDIEKLPDEIKSLDAFENNIIRIDNSYFERATTDISKLIRELNSKVQKIKVN